MHRQGCGPHRLRQDQRRLRKLAQPEKAPVCQPEKASLSQDEHPNHRVSITRDFEITATEITNVEYEAFDPAHRAERGRMGFSIQDYEAAVFVSYENATAFARWLTERDPSRHWRLPTEA